MAMMTTMTARAAAAVMAIGLLAACGSKHESEREQASAETSTDAMSPKSSPVRGDDDAKGAVATPPARAKAEMIVVFQKGVDEAAATTMLDATRLPYRSGSDSSRGKGYFYAHGPQFIVTTDTAGGAVLKGTLGSRPEVFDVYEADWEAQKD